MEELDYLAFCRRIEPGVRLLATTGDWYRPHPWLSLFLPSNSVERYVAAALDWMTPRLLGPIPMLLYPLRRGAVMAPRLVTPESDEDGLLWSFSILRTVADDADLIDAARAENAALSRAAIEAGGTIYASGEP